MVDVLVRNWWTLVLRGGLAILFAIMAWVWPGVTLSVVVFIFGVFIFIEGILTIVAAVSGRTGGAPTWALAVHGFFSIIFGVMVFAWPDITLLVFVLVFGAWQVLTGALTIANAIRVRKEIEGEWFLIVSGAIAVLFGVLIMFQPIAGAYAIGVLIGIYAFMHGCLLIALGFEVRRLHQGPVAPAAA